MGDLLKFPVVHRDEILRQEEDAQLSEAFSSAAKALGLTLAQIDALAPIPRSFFEATAAALIFAERRGELPKPVQHRGKLCYPASDLAIYALNRHRFDWFTKSVALSLAIYRDYGNPRSLVVCCYTKRKPRAELLCTADRLIREALYDEDSEIRDFAAFCLESDS